LFDQARFNADAENATETSYAAESETGRYEDQK